MSEPQPYHGTDEPMLDFVWEAMNGARIQTELALMYVQARDPVGLEYATRNLVAYVKAAIPTVKELRADHNAAVVARGRVP